MDESVSEFIVRTCRILPKSHTSVFESIDLVGVYGFVRDGLRIVCGSCAEFFIQPLHSCVDDIDYCRMKPNILAFTDEKPVLPYDVRISGSTQECYLMEPSLAYPAFLQLRLLGQIKYNWNAKIFELIPTSVHKIAITAEMDDKEAFNIDAVFCRVGPANRGRVAKRDSISVDIVNSVWCPQWPKEAQHWPSRRRKYGWPTIALIHEIVQNGCHVVFAKHPDCRNDIHQCRLSFSLSEVMLIQSWTPVQQIVYHMLRFFVKRELIKKDCPKEDEVLCTYHIKTLMLWSCEEISPDWWNSLSVIKICCNLFEKLLQWLKKTTCPNYFIPKANLFHKHFNRESVDETVGKLIYFSNSDILSSWFVRHYVKSRIPDECDANFTRDISSCVYEHMVQTCKAMKADKGKAIDLYVNSRFCNDAYYAHNAVPVDEVLQNALLDFSKYILRIGSLFEYKINFWQCAEIESFYWLFGSMLRTLHAAYLLDCQEIEYDSPRFVHIIRRVFIKPKFLRSMHHNLPRPLALKLVNRRQRPFIKAQDLMENLTGSCNCREFIIVSEMSKMLLRSALECNGPISNTNTILCYMAALHFVASEYQIVTDLCSRVIINERNTKQEKETLNAGCLLYVEEISKIIGFYLLYRKIRKVSLHYTKRQFFLDLRLTPEVFARYLTIESVERTDESFGSNDISQTPTYPLDGILMSITNKKKSRISRVYQRNHPMKKLEAVKIGSFPDTNRISQLLMEYSLQNVTLFYNKICKDSDIFCNAVDCYRAAYLYKCCRYSKVLKLCERILDEPDLSNNSKRNLVIHIFANVMVLPPLDSYFDGDVQSLLGIHTLFCFLSPLYEDITGTQKPSRYMMNRFFYQKVRCEKYSLYKVLQEGFIVRCHYFIGRHFLARYLKVRCLVDRRSISDAVSEFHKLKASLPFEIIMRCFLRQKLRRLLKDVDS